MHRIEEVPCLMRGLRSPLAAGDDGRAGDSGDRLLPAVSMTCSNMFSRCRRVAAESPAQPVVSR
jgi:hypothetical protein